MAGRWPSSSSSRGRSRRRVADIGRQILDALVAGHAVGVLHRDLKPGNVLITSQGRAVLTDFGIASVAGDPSLTRTGMVVGTPSYLAPERARGVPATAAADLWSFGATLYAAVSGRGPFDGYEDAIATMYAILAEDPPALPAGDPLTPIIAALLARDPARRPGAAETARALAEPVTGEPARPQLAQTRSAQTRSGQTQPAQTLPARGDADPAAVRAGTPTITSGLLLPTGSGTEPGPRPTRGRRPGTALVSGLAVVAVAAAAVTTVLLTSSPGHHQVSLSGAGAPVPVTEQFRVAAVTAAGGTELFARGRDGSLRTNRLAGESWSGWSSLPGGTAYAGVPAVASTPAGQVIVFDRTTDGNLVYLWQDGPGSRSWHGPVVLGSTLVSSDPSVVTWPDGHLQVFARLAHGVIGTDAQQAAGSAGGWQGWQSLGGNLAGPPVAAMDETGHPQVFGLAPDGGLLANANEGGQWTGWRPLPGTDQFTGLPAVGHNADGRLELFARTRSGAIEHVWQQAGHLADWGGPGTLFSQATGDPSVFSTKGGRMEVFVTAPDGTVQHTWQDTPLAGAPWVRPQSLQGNSDAALTPLRVGAASELFARTAAGAIDYDYLLTSGAGSWSGWDGLGGSFLGGRRTRHGDP